MYLVQVIRGALQWADLIEVPKTHLTSLQLYKRRHSFESDEVRAPETSNCKLIEDPEWEHLEACRGINFHSGAMRLIRRRCCHRGRSTYSHHRPNSHLWGS